MSTKSISKICQTSSLVGILLASVAIGQIEYGSFEFDGYEREYIVFLPENYEPGSPLVLNLHGDGMGSQ